MLPFDSIEYFMVLIFNCLFFSSPSCLLHDSIFKYLQQSIHHQPNYINSLNANLINGYANQCQRKWFKYPYHDHYFYQYLMEHAVRAKDDKTIQEILKDFKWMNDKLQSDNTIYDLCIDIEKAINFLRIKHIEVCYIDQ